MKIDWYEVSGKWRLEDNILVVAFDELKMDNPKAIALFSTDRTELPFYMGSILLENIYENELEYLMEQLFDK